METKLSWEPEKELVGANGVCVKVTVLRLRFPVYSYEIGVMNEKGFSRHFRADQDITDLGPTIDRAKLYVDGMMKLSQQLREQFNKERDDRSAAEVAAKAARGAHKSAKHEANLARRRLEDQARARGGTGGGGKKKGK